VSALDDLIDACSAMPQRDAAQAELEALRDKAMRFELDQLGIEQRELRLVEIFELRDQVEELEQIRQDAITGLGRIDRALGAGGAT